MLPLESYGLSSNFQELKYVWLVYSSTEGDTEEREVLERLRVVDRVGNGYRLCVLGDLNGGLEVA